MKTKTIAVGDTYLRGVLTVYRESNDYVKLHISEPHQQNTVTIEMKASELAQLSLALMSIAGDDDDAL